MSKKTPISNQKDELLNEIDPAVKAIVEKLPDEQRNVILKSMTIAEYHGPIPPPALLKQYNEVIPDAAERILRMAEGEQLHRHKTFNWMVRASIIRRFLGLFLGVAIVAAVLYVSYLFAMADHDTLAGTFGTITIVSLAVIFVLNREPSKMDKEKM